MSKKEIIIKTILISILLIILMIYIYKNYFNNNENYFYSDNSMFIITKNYDGKISYYELNDMQKVRKTDKFESDNLTIYNTYGCIESDIEQVKGKNKLVNKYSKANCKIFDINEDEINIDNDIEKVIKKISKISDKYGMQHYIFDSTIYIVGKEIYVQIPFNVNLWSPYEFYKYNQEENKLKLLYTFDDESVIGIKIKDNKK